MICNYCNLWGEEVKDNGWEYCPNPMCDSPGADWSKYYLRGYSPIHKNYPAWELIQFTVDWLMNKGASVDPSLRDKIISDLSIAIHKELGVYDVPSLEGKEQEA